MNINYQQEIEELKKEIAIINEQLSLIVPYVEKSIDAEESLASYYKNKLKDDAQ